MILRGKPKCVTFAVASFKAFRAQMATLVWNSQGGSPVVRDVLTPKQGAHYCLDVTVQSGQSWLALPDRWIM